MNTDPRVESWLVALLDGVQNSNSHAEVIAQAAYYFHTPVPRSKPNFGNACATSVSHARATMSGKCPRHRLPVRPRWRPTP